MSKSGFDPAETIVNLTAKNKELSCRMEYLETENAHLKEQIDLVKKTEVENEELRANLREVTVQNEVLRAQLNVVHLIFGRNH